MWAHPRARDDPQVPCRWLWRGRRDRSLPARPVSLPRGARGVGFCLHRNPEPGVIPCHRVVFADGRLASAFAFGGEGVQRAMLEAEGVEFLPDGRVDMAKCGI